jgi:chromosome segregation ATPase
MMRPFILCLILSAFAWLPGHSLFAADAASPAETKLRENLRATLLQLRKSEGDRATAEAAQSDAEQAGKELKEQLTALTKKSTDAQIVAEKDISALSTKVAGLEANLTQLKAELAKSQAEHKAAAELAAGKEAERAKLAEKIIGQDRKIADQQTKNLALFKTGSEILTRLEKFGLGQAITAREPFVGLTRVKLQNLSQDYTDKLQDQRIKP